MTDRLVFKAEDFDQTGMYDIRDAAARIAQAKFDAWLAAQPVVWGTPTGSTPLWYRAAAEVFETQRNSSHTHRARLCCIEKLEGE